MRRLLVCGVDFGWGSAGKLAAILEALRLRNGGAVHVTGICTALGRGVIPRGLVDEWVEDDLRDGSTVQRVVAETLPDACLIILDPELADRLASAGCPVVYVDSLPHLWTEHDPLPRLVSRYCAQRGLTVPPSAERLLAELPSVTWVDPIVSPSLLRAAPQPVEDDLLLVNVGGIHSPLAYHSAAADYLALTLPPLASAAADFGAQRLLLAGNVAQDDVPGVDGIALELHKPSHSEFAVALQRARWVATSPGLTTLLEIAALGRTAVILPPQNLSQFHHLRHVAAVTEPALTVPWPATVLDPDQVQSWHGRGEEHAVARIYAALSAAAAAPTSGLDSYLRQATARAFSACEERPSALGALGVSFEGATQVAECVEELLGLE